MSLAQSSERKSRADDRLHETALDQRGERVQLSGVLSCEDEVIGGVLAPRLDEVLRLRDVHDADDASGVGECQRASCERVATDRVEDDIDPLAARHLGNGIDVVRRREVDRCIRSERAHELVVAGFRGRDHSCANRVRELDRDRADTARAAMDEDRLSHGELSSRHQGLPDRSADERQARRLQVTEVLGLAGDEVDVGDVLLGVGAGAAEDPGRVVDRVAGAELGHVGSDFLDHAGDVVSDDRRERH